VRFPVRVAFGHAFEDRSRGRHLVIEFRKNAVAYRHGFSPVIDFLRGYLTPSLQMQDNRMAVRLREVRGPETSPFVRQTSRTLAQKKNGRRYLAPE
jgi:hypothetical protein